MCIIVQNGQGGKWVNWGSSKQLYQSVIPKRQQDAALHAICGVKQKKRSSASKTRIKQIKVGVVV